MTVRLTWGWRLWAALVAAAVFVVAAPLLSARASQPEGPSAPDPYAVATAGDRRGPEDTSEHCVDGRNRHPRLALAAALAPDNAQAATPDSSNPRRHPPCDADDRKRASRGTASPVPTDANEPVVFPLLFSSWLVRNIESRPLTTPTLTPPTTTPPTTTPPTTTKPIPSPTATSPLTQVRTPAAANPAPASDATPVRRRDEPRPGAVVAPSFVVRRNGSRPVPPVRPSSARARSIESAPVPSRPSTPQRSAPVPLRAFDVPPGTGNIGAATAMLLLTIVVLTAVGVGVIVFSAGYRGRRI